MSIKEKYAYYLLEKKQRRIIRNVKLFDFNSARKIGILWHINNKDAFYYLADFLKDKKVICRNLCYNGESNEVIANSFNSKETNLFGFPKASIANTFIESDFDILMNISIEDSFPLQVLTALSNAKFKIGWTKNPINYFDLTIDISKNINALYLVKQQIFYLEQFNKKN